MNDRLALTDFADPTPEIRPVGSVPVEFLGDVEVDGNGQVHVCFVRADLTGVMWAHGLGPDDWQEEIVPETDQGDVYSSIRCQLAVNATGSDLWIVQSLAELSIRHKIEEFEVEDLQPFVPAGGAGLLWDVTLGVGGQPVVVGSRHSLDGTERIWFVARRLGDAEWTSEIIAAEPLLP